MKLSGPDAPDHEQRRAKGKRLGLCLAKTSYTRRMNDLRKTGFRFSRYNSCHDCVASTFPRLVGRHFPFSGGPRPREPGSPSTIAGSACATTSPSIDCPAQAVLGCVEIVLVWVEKAARLGYSSKCRELASSRVSFVLVMDLESQTIRRAEACQQRDSHLDLSYGCRESDLGSAAHSRRTSEAGLRGLSREPGSLGRYKLRWFLIVQAERHGYCSVSSGNERQAS